MLYSSSKVKTITIEDILSRLTEYDIYAYYLGGNFTIGSRFKSPWRRDVNPSFGIFRSDNGSLLYKDLGTGDTGNCVSFVQRLLNYPKTKYGYILTLERIYEDIITQCQDYSNRSLEHTLPLKETKTNKVPLTIKRRPWSKSDADYWNSYYISHDTLTKFEVHPIQYVFINKIIKWTYTIDNPMYAYKVYNGFKIYRPLAKKNEKWLSSCTRFDMQGFKQLQETGDLLIITKSLKDVMVLHELGYSAIAPHAESHDIPKVIMQDLKKRFKHIVLLYDRDPTGMKGVRKLVRKYGLDWMFIHKMHKLKDISDFVKKHTLTEGNKLLKELLNEHKR